MSQSKLSKIESGSLLPSADDVEALCEPYKVSGPQKRALLDLLRLIRTEYSSWRIELRNGLAAKQMEVAAREAASASITEFQPVVIPGLLQLPDYAREIMRLVNIHKQGDIEQGVRSRVARQAALHDRSKKFRFILTEAALYSRFCPGEVAQLQLNYLARVVLRMPNVVLGLLPLAVRLPRIPQNPFAMYDSGVVIEGSSGMLILTDERDRALYEEMFNDYLGVALTGKPAREFLLECSSRLEAMADEGETGPVALQPK